MERGNQAGEAKKWRFRMVTVIELEEADAAPRPGALGITAKIWRQSTDGGWVETDEKTSKRILGRGGFQRVDSLSPITTGS